LQKEERISLGKKSFELPKTISETIYEYLRNAIIEGDLKANERIPERKIAKLFNVSATPVREAFRRLSAEKLLTINARKEVFVSTAELNVVHEIFEVIRINDPIASKKAIARLTDRDISELEILTEKLSSYYKRKNDKFYFRINLRIHALIWKRCGNKILYQTLFGLLEKLYIYINHIILIHRDLSYFAKSYQDHLDLMNAIVRRDIKEVERITRSHWRMNFF